MTADANLAAAATTLERLAALGPAAYTQNGPALISEGMLAVALAEAHTNRVLALLEYGRRTTDPDTLAAIHAELAALVAGMVPMNEKDGPDAEAPEAEGLHTRAG